MSYVVTDAAGTITVTDAALDRIVVQAAESVEGVRVRRPRRGIDVHVQGGQARTSLELTVQYGLVLRETAQAVQSAIATALETMCGLRGVVDLHIEELQ